MVTWLGLWLELAHLLWHYGGDMLSIEFCLCWVVFVSNSTFVVAWVVTRTGHVFGTSLWYLSENQRRQAVQRSVGMAYPFHAVPLRGHVSACRTSSIRLPVVSYLGEIANHTRRRYSTDRPRRVVCGDTMSSEWRRSSGMRRDYDQRLTETSIHSTLCESRLDGNGIPAAEMARSSVCQPNAFPHVFHCYT